MTSDGRRLLSALVVSQSTKTLADMQLGVEMFKGSEVPLFEFVMGHVLTFGKLPSPDTIEENSEVLGALVATTEPPEYYQVQVERRFLHTQLKEVVLVAQEHLKEDAAESAFEALVTKIGELMQKKNKHHLFDFRDATEVIINELALKKADTGDYFVKFGWPYLDNMTGGMRGGDMISFVGRPAAGKTFKLLYTAHTGWRVGHTPLFFSMEMNKVIITHRLAAMDVQYPLSHLLKATVSDMAMVKIVDKLDSNKDRPNPFWVVDGNLATNIDDIVMQCRQLKPSVVFVDGAYLLRHQNQKLSKWDRMSENAEMLKQRVATDLDLPVVCSYQFSRETKKKKKGDKAGVEDIYGSDAIGQLSTVVLGLLEEESVKTLHSRRVDILKGRNGEVGAFDINWDFHKMDFSEIVEEEAEELQFCD